MENTNQKVIRQSDRGLTFSFSPRGRFNIGSGYDYIIEKAAGSIRIIPSEKGRYKLSRKKRSHTWNALIDLRNKEIASVLAHMENIRISISDDEILVSEAKESAKANGIILRFPRTSLAELRLVAGMDAAEAASTILHGADVAYDGTTQGGYCPLNVSRVQDDLTDVYTLVSLFSGAGILDWPFAQDSRFKIQYAIDYDAAACETYRHNIGTHIIHGDIHKAFTAEGYPLDKTVSSPDVIIGGPSCKPFSNANRHTRLSDHPDSDLVVQYMRIVKALRPKVWVIENVPEVLTACDGAYFDAIREAAADCGYDVSARIVQDSKVGGYTTRKRAVILGSCVGPAVFRDINIVSGEKTVGDALSKITDDWTNTDDVTFPKPDTKLRMSFVPQGGNYESIPEKYRTGSKNRHSCTYRRLAWDQPSPTIVNWRKPPLIHPTEDRTLTVAEAKALQGLPGDYRIYGSLGQMQQQVGNAVPVALGRYIKTQVLAALS